MKDKVLENLIQKEIVRQKETINLIPSENFPSKEILRIVGSPLMDKYSEGYPGKRYYPGNFYFDKIEELAKERALKAFGLNGEKWAVNVQPYSGSPANIAVYLALLNFGDKLMGLGLSSGGHLTHGAKVNFSGQAYKSISYEVNNKTGLIDYRQVEILAKKNRPKMIISGLTAYPRKIDFSRFSRIAHKIKAYHLADISHIAGLVLAGLYPSPFKDEVADIIMTTTHKILRGPRGAVIFINKQSKIARYYKVDLEAKINKAVFPGIQGGPHNNIVAAIAQTFFEAKSQQYKNYADQVVKNTGALCEELKKYGFDLITGGTDNHLIVIDLKKLNISGREAEEQLEKNGILANRNIIFGDRSPFVPSGLRLGTPAITTRGMKEKEMKLIAKFIFRILIEKQNIKSAVVVLAKKFPLKYDC
jgi:glycine hydroxymethyltransferase